MRRSLIFLRLLFMLLSILFMTLYMNSLSVGTTWVHTLIGVSLGGALGCLLIGADLLMRRFSLRSFNIAVLGMFLGYLMGQAVLLILGAILDISSASITLSPMVVEIIKMMVFLCAVYLGTILTLRCSDEISVSIPFISFTSLSQKKKDFLVDISVLGDLRIIDLVATGLFDHQLIVPRFVIKELYLQMEASEERVRNKAKKGIETLKQLDSMAHVALRYSDTDFPQVEEIMSKMVRLAKLLEGNILSADSNRVQPPIEGVTFINMHTLANALKPVMGSGEMVRIKVQRLGKEAGQGVGYLEDGTMVVVNGGGNYLGAMIDAHVLSVKNTASGRMIFCNVTDPREEIHPPVEEEGPLP